MAKSDRLLELMQLLRTLPSPVTATQLAQELGASERTIYRYIDNLRAAGAVIDGAAGYGFTVVEDAAMPPMMFNQDEIEALVLGLREVQQVADPVLADAARNVLSKVNASLPKDMQRQLQSAVLYAKKFRKLHPIKIDIAALRKATRDEQVLDMLYSDQKEAVTTRTIWPLSIVFMDESLVLLAYCQLRKDYRMFRVDRIKELHFTDTSFKPRRVGMLRECLEQIQSENC
ncbi:YafY family transcriptional regulator [Amylibacter sp. SFDW26]|uniref:helix-turn-helix transcriptional regulator n=1 Tax=Amylibacter sp. SFDW26 TaxID=2652722 RepID=UPI0012628405|nr:YafY family protein [Amylibacter sp. SFDW26]KAB7614357.1 YafY family transcriptional regulator [Amylibacter sp. SFDW26]